MSACELFLFFTFFYHDINFTLKVRLGVGVHSLNFPEAALLYVKERTTAAHAH